VDCYVGIGTNLGDRSRNLAFALRALEERALVPQAVSSIWETEPVDADGSPWFWNMTVKLSTDRPPLELLDLLQEIETRSGRVRTERNAPRTLDLDILMIDGMVLDEPRLSLPHPQMWRRRFVLEPLAEIAPDLRNPATGRTVVQERAGLDDPHVARNIGRLASRRDLPV
jgi:2-amino-4-hydroxy-6-hydroxymethyldihydropteridine diphosphokinase